MKKIWRAIRSWFVYEDQFGLSVHERIDRVIEERRRQSKEAIDQFEALHLRLATASKENDYEAWTSAYLALCRLKRRYAWLDFGD